jgi:hypothetical protein
MEANDAPVCGNKNQKNKIKINGTLSRMEFASKCKKKKEMNCGMKPVLITFSNSSKDRVRQN